MPRITELPAETTPADDDPLAIVDNSGAITKQITRENLLKGSPLPANTVDQQSIQDNSVGAAELAPGTVVQDKVATFTSSATGTTTIPLDDSEPQSGEGNEYMTLSFTPTNADNRLDITALAYCANSAADLHIIGAIFAGSATNSIGASSMQSTANNAIVLPISASMTAGTTSAITFRVRLGGSGAGTLTFNGRAGGRNFGAITKSMIKVTEVKV